MAHRNPYRLAEFTHSRRKGGDGATTYLIILSVIFVLMRDFLETSKGKICCISIAIIFIIWYFYEVNESA